MTAATHKQTAPQRGRLTPYRFIGVGAALCFGALLACGGGPKPPPSEAYLDAVFSRIQVHEAALQDASTAANRAQTEAERNRARQRADAAVKAICDLAAQSVDADAQRRCEIAQSAHASSVASTDPIPSAAYPTPPAPRTTDVKLD